MPRIRTIKPSFWSDASVAGVSRDARLLMLGLISTADDRGRFVATPVAVAGAVFPYDDLATSRIRRWLDELSTAHLIELYRCEGRDYGCLPGWGRHQKISHPQPSPLPPPPEPFRSHSGTPPERDRRGSRATPESFRMEKEEEEEEEGLG